MDSPVSFGPAGRSTTEYVQYDVENRASPTGRFRDLSRAAPLRRTWCTFSAPGHQLLPHEAAPLCMDLSNRCPTFLAVFHRKGALHLGNPAPEPALRRSTPTYHVKMFPVSRGPSSAGLASWTAKELSAFGETTAADESHRPFCSRLHSTASSTVYACIGRHQGCGGVWAIGRQFQLARSASLASSQTRSARPVWPAFLQSI